MADGEGSVKDPEPGDDPASPTVPTAVTGVPWELGRCRKGPVLGKVVGF